jgi:hypothetical protein
MPPKRKMKKPVKVAQKRKIAKGKRTGTLDEGEEDGKPGLCTACNKLGWYRDYCYSCDSGAMCNFSIAKSTPLGCFLSD